MRMFRLLRGVLIPVVMAGLLALNVMTLTVGTVFDALSGLLSSLGAATVQEPLARQLDDERKLRTQAETRGKNLSRRVKSLQTENTKLSGRVNTLQTENAKLSGRVNTLQTENAKRTERVKTLQSENTKLTGHVNTLRTENTKLTGRIGSLEGQLDHARERAAARARLVGQRTSRIARRMVATAGLNIAAMPLEALPIIGIATIVGTTAVEIANACATMNDMEEIRRAFDHETDGEYTAAELCGMKVPDEEDTRRRRDEELKGDRLRECLEKAGPNLPEQRACNEIYGSAGPPPSECDSLECCLKVAGPDMSKQRECQARFPG